MSRFVFCGAADGRVLVSVDQQPVGSAATAEELAGLFMLNGIAAGDDIYCSSTIDFCEEEGFEPGAAGEMITEALDCFGDQVVDFYGS